MYNSSDIRRSDRHDAESAYIDRRESEPLRSHAPLQKRNLIRFDLPERHDSCHGGTCFPNEPKLRILPNMGACLPGKGCNAALNFMNSRQNDQNRKLDIFKGLNFTKPSKRRRY